MLEPAVIVLRLVQYAGAMFLMGSSLFFIYALPSAGPGSAAEAPWARRLLASAGALLALATLLWIAAQASVLAGSMVEGLKPEALGAVMTSKDLGKAGILRAGVAFLAAILAMMLRPARASWVVAAALGTVATATFAWMGHGAATEGPRMSKIYDHPRPVAPGLEPTREKLEARRQPHFHCCRRARGDIVVAVGVEEVALVQQILDVHLGRDLVGDVIEHSRI